MDAPREVFRATRGPVELDTTGRTLTGYLAVFNSPTKIEGWEGEFVERIMPGAFKRTLKNNGDRVRIMFNHGMFPAQFQNMPLGKATVLREDDHGLYVEVPLSRTSYNDDLIELINDGAVDGMSFRGNFTKDVWRRATTRDGLPERDVTEVALAEGGPVVWPAYEMTTVGLRSAPNGDYTFAPALWQGLSDDQRDQITTIIRGNRTPASGPANGTPLSGPAKQRTPDPQGAHSGDPSRIRRAHVAAHVLEELLNNAR